MNEPFRNAFLSIAAVAVLGACGDDDNPTSGGPVPAEKARVGVAHLAPGAVAVDVWVDGNKELTAVPFEYAAVPAGTYDPEVRA